jgi:nucleoside-diphosphate-sugar epimerase
MKRIYLTGGTGLIGTSIRHLLAHKSFEIYALTREKRRRQERHVRWVYGDMEKPSAAVLDMIPAMDGVIHAGALIDDGSGDNRFRRIRAINMAFSERLFEQCADCRREIPVVYLSSLSVLKRPVQGTVTEEDPVGPDTLYGVSKYWGEQALFFHAQRSRYRPISIRPTSPIRFTLEALHNNVVKQWILSSMNSGTIHIYKTGRRTQDFVATDDIAHAVVNAMQSPRAQGIYHIGSGKPISMKELACLISRKMKSSLQWEDKDGNDAEQWKVSTAKARKDFGYAPTYDSSRAVIKALLAAL